MVRPTWLVWPGLTIAVTVVLGVIGWWIGKVDTLRWIAFGAATSGVTSVMGWLTIERTRLKREPVARTMAETSIRMAFPLGVLFAMAVTRRDLLTEENLAFFLPFQFVTIVAGVNRALVEVKESSITNSDTKPKVN